MSIKIKRGDNLQTTPPLILDDGQLAYDKATKTLKIGNGQSQWSDLPKLASSLDSDSSSTSVAQELGTWTPSLVRTGNTVSLGTSVVVGNCYYTRTGVFVTCSITINISISNISGAPKSARFQIQGLPFDTGLSFMGYGSIESNAENQGNGVRFERTGLSSFSAHLVVDGAESYLSSEDLCEVDIETLSGSATLFGVLQYQINDSY